MNRLYNSIKGLPRRLKIEAAIAVSLTIAVTMFFPVYAWFSSQRKLGDLERVDTPTRLFITAAHDDIKYLQLTNIQVSDSSVKNKYYVFSVSGKAASYYNLQLAYTTNNQFEYFIYPAKQVSESDSPLVFHTAHNDKGEETTTYYYTIETDPLKNTPSGSFQGANDDPNARYRLWNESVIYSEQITTRFINKDANSLVANSTKHNDTYSYKRYDDNNANLAGENVPAPGVGAQLYCEPIYWQALRIPSVMDASNQFEDYYILEVNWEKALDAAGSTGLLDNKETDIIYIAAEATS